MTHYADKSNSVRVDFFRDTGKWYCTEAVLMDGPYEGILARIFFEACIKRLTKEGSLRLAGMWAVCIDPYHANSYPMMCKIPETLP